MNKVKTCRYGEMIYPPHDTYIGRSLDLYGEFSEGEAALFRQLVRPGNTVLDVGANIGAHTVPLARLVGPSGQVLAFEPQRIPYYCLCANVVLNHLVNVRCYQAAVGPAPGTIQVPELNQAVEQNFGALELTRPAPGVRTDEVPVRTIDGLGLGACHFIKVDVEGMEADVLAGAVATIRAFQPILYVEDDRPARRAALRALLASLGYEMYVHAPPLYNPANFASSPENVFGRTVSLNLFCHPAGAPCPIDPAEYGMTRVALADRAPAAPLPELVVSGQQAYQAGDLPRAEECFRQFLRAEPANAQAWYLLGAVCQVQKKLDEAVAALEEALRRNPDHPEAHNHLGVTLAAQGRLPEAEAHFRQAVRLAPGLAEAHDNLGMALTRQGKAGEAVACHRQAVRLRPGFAQAWANLRQTLRTEGRPEEVLATYREGPAEPDVSASNQLGLDLRDRGKLEEAVAAFRHTLRVKPDLAEVHTNLGAVLALQGK
jgi:FkbM family methyltransferase